MSNRPPLQSFHSGYGENAKTAVLAPQSGKQLKVYRIACENRSGGAIDVGICVKLAAQSWQLGTLTAASTPDFLDKTSVIQAGSVVNVFSIVNNGGFLIQADRPFNIVGLTVSQGESGSPVYTYEYYNGSAYTTLTGISLPTAYAASDKLLVFEAPQDWALGTTAAVGGATNLYSLRVLATTAPGQVVQATAAWVGKFLEFQAGLADKTQMSTPLFAAECPLVLESGEGIMPYFSGSASAQNQVSGYYALSD